MQTEINVEKLTFLQKIKYFFVKPSKVFEGYIDKPVFWLKLAFIGLIAIVYGISTQYLSKDILIEMTREQMANLPPEQAEAAIDSMKLFIESPFGIAITAGGALISVIVSILIVSLIYFWLIKLFKGKISYKQVLSIYTFSYIAILIGMVLKLIYMSVTGNLAYINLKPDYMYILFEYLDVFMIWQLILMVLGITAVTKMPEKKSLAIVSVVWLMSIGFSMGIIYVSQAFGKAFGM